MLRGLSTNVKLNNTRPCQMEIKTVVVGDTDAGASAILMSCYARFVGKTSLSERFCYGDSPMSASNYEYVVKQRQVS